MKNNKLFLTAFCSYTFFVLLNNTLNLLFIILFFKNQHFRFSLTGNVCRLVDDHEIPYVLILYFIVKLTLLLYAVWRILKLKKDAVLNLLIMNMALFNLAGGIIASGILNLPNVFFSDIHLYFLSGILCNNNYFLIPLILGLTGVFFTCCYFIKYRFNIRNILLYTTGILAGIILPLLLLKIILLITT